MARLTILLLALLLGACAVPVERRHSPADLQAYRVEDFAWPAASRAGERTLLAEEHARLRANLAQPERLPQALAAVMLFNIEVDAGREALLAALPSLATRPVEYQRALLTAAYTLYATESAPLIRPLLPLLPTPREFAIAAYVVQKADGASSLGLMKALRQRPDCCDEPRLRALAEAVLPPRPTAQPSLIDLFSALPHARRPIVFSLQRPGRQALGLALVRGPDGSFVRDAQGKLLMIDQLALARSGLPGTITYGNTPRGLYTVRGAGTADNRWIGPTPYLNSMLPIEASMADFLHEPELGKTWAEDAYAAMLPTAWRDSLMEAWWAGQAGRGEILMHGTTINPDYYAGQPYFPGTPSAGCLVTGETWSSEDGRLLSSDQLRLAKAFTSSGKDAGYLFVAEIAGAGAVRNDELMAAALAAEHQLLAAAGR